MIWISFLSNILILGTALFLLKLHKSQMSSNQFIWFILLTGISSGVAAFGHLPLLEKVKTPIVVDGDDKLIEIGKNNNWECISFR